MNQKRPPKASRLRNLLAGPEILQIPGVFNPLLAKLVETAGFPAVYVSGAGLSNANLGMPDVGLLSMIETVRMAGRIARSISVPALCDADTGYGGPEMIRRAVQEFIHAGVAGIHIEDQIAEKKCGHLEGKNLAPVEEMIGRLKAALSGRSDPDFVVIARTDARSVEGMESALDRSMAYVDAGADVIFPEALESSDEFARFAETVPVPILANMTEFGRSPLLSVEDLQSAGVRAIIYPQTCLRVMMRSAEETLQTLYEEGSQISLLERMQTREELYDLLGYNDWKESDR